jgi:hypothetical protein
MSTAAAATGNASAEGAQSLHRKIAGQQRSGWRAVFRRSCCSRSAVSRPRSARRLGSFGRFPSSSVSFSRLPPRSRACSPASPAGPRFMAPSLGSVTPISRTLATPEPIRDWSLTSLKEKLIKIGAKVVRHGRDIAFQMAEVAIPRDLFADILRLIAVRISMPRNESHRRGTSG